MSTHSIFRPEEQEDTSTLAGALAPLEAASDDNSDPVMNAGQPRGKKPNGAANGAANNGLGADADILGADSPYTEDTANKSRADTRGDLPSAEAHAGGLDQVTDSSTALDNYSELIPFLHGKLKFNVVPNNAQKKHPAVRWKEYQTNRVTEDELAAWHEDGLFNGGVGIITGEISNVVILDTDGPEGEAVISAWEALHGTLPKTLTWRSSSGRGLHRCFKHPGGKVTTRANAAIKLDIKGDGGYAVLCKSGNPWRVVSDTHEITELPEGLLDFIKAKADAAKANGSTNGADATAFSANTYSGDGSRPYTKRAEIELRSATAIIDGVNSYDAWASKCLAYLRLGWPDEIAFDTFHELCARSEGYVSREDCAAKWEENKQHVHDVRSYISTIDSVFKEAYAKGWKFPHRRDDYEDLAKIGEGVSSSQNGGRKRHGYMQPPKGTGLVVINADEVEPEETTWICQDVIPRGKLSIFAGNPGFGKSQLSMYFAATVTTGGKWPSAMGDIQTPRSELLLYSRLKIMLKIRSYLASWR